MLDQLQDLSAGLKEATRDWVARFYAAQFGKKERIQFYESLMGVLEDGISIEVALETVQKAFSNDGKELHPVSIVCSEIAMSVRGGKSLAQSCRRRLPYEEVSLIETGEETGKLVQAFRDCVRIIEIRQRIARLIQSVVAMPSLTWSLMWALLYVIALWMVPSMTKRSDPDAWTGVPALLYHLSNLVSHYGFFILGSVVIVILTATLTLPVFCGLALEPTSPTWKIQLSRILQKARLNLESAPPWSIYKVLHGSIFLMNMSVMLRSGINQLDALTILKRGAPPWLRERLDAIHYGVRSGKNFGQALKLAGHKFPDAMAIHYLEVLAVRKGFAESMERFASRWLEQTLRKVEATSKFLIAFSSVCMGVLMILVVVGIFQMARGVMDSANF
ncbi:type II secretion system F family protein [Pseudomonas sessilinigenes]|uniref:type II secretion system F family protein n=1 Tax=Pseudomonas sessilinigenes TaxID=658629 RepID=UPI000F56D161|nr:type II secretion system F family protein [Pseudomonas sessilinigenes]AZC24837.1 Conjugative transfer protein PilR in PFGI-1-like cluster [Pseudomonas sessilinigenes]